jgi:large repetitive protein
VTFTPPASSGQSAITKYTVTASPGGNTASAASGPITIKGLTNGTGYTFTVTATNKYGTGPASSPSNRVIIGRPGAPTGVAATAGDKEATVSFTPPASNGGSPITSYTVISHPGNIKASGTESPITVKGLTNGKTYTFTVKATNASGSGPISTRSNKVTPATPPTITVTSPDGGETWLTGKKYLISWNYTKKPGATVLIELVNGSSSTVIKAGRSIGSRGTGYYSWAIPKDQATGSGYKVRVTSTTQPSCTAESSGTFTIAAGATSASDRQ